MREFLREILNISLGEYRERIIDSFIERISYVLEGEDFEKPKNIAKGLLVWLDEHEVLGDMLNGLYEWDYLTAEEREEMANAIYERLEELAEKEEKWAGLSPEEWLELLRKRLVEEKVIKATDAAFWKWTKHHMEKKDAEDIYDLLNRVFEGNVDWDWMPRKERRELAEEVIDLIKEKIEKENLRR